MPDDMDLNRGDIVPAGVSLADKGLQIFNRVTKSEALGLGDDEFVPLQTGAVM